MRSNRSDALDPTRIVAHVCVYAPVAGVLARRTIWYVFNQTSYRPRKRVPNGACPPIALIGEPDD